MTAKTKFGTGILLLTMLLVGVVLVPAVNAQEENKYSITAEEAFKQANAHMIHFIVADSDFKNWTGASIDPKPIELYDINGKRLFYQFSVNKNNEIIGKIKVCADKTLGQSVQSFEFDPRPFDATEAIKKSIEIAKNRYPNAEIKSTKVVVYNYPQIGAMTVVKNKTTGDEHRIFVDVYKLDIVEDKPATETEPGVWSMYEQASKNGVEKNLKDWQESDQLTNYIEQEAADEGIDINSIVTEEKVKKLRGDAAIYEVITSKTLSVPLYGQETDYYCAPTSAQMIAAYHGVSHTQSYIYQLMGPNYGSSGGVYPENQLQYYTSSSGLNKPNSVSTTISLTFNNAVSEINSYRPFKSGITGHARVCKGYSYTDFGVQYLKINDPSPVGSGFSTVESPGQEVNRIYVR